MVLRELGEIAAAKSAFETAATLRPLDERLVRNLRSVDQPTVPPWHFRMLADSECNDAYQRAIERAVSPNLSVLDIGTGSGLLAMMAARAGAGRVTACEVSPHIAAAARQVVADNGPRKLDVWSTAGATHYHQSRVRPRHRGLVRPATR